MPGLDEWAIGDNTLRAQDREAGFRQPSLKHVHSCSLTPDIAPDRLGTLTAYRCVYRAHMNGMSPRYDTQHSGGGVWYMLGSE